MPNSPFTLNYELQQHTPYIHFQSEQKGATLRATELKPKLDKYLITEYFEGDFEKFKHLLVGYKGQKSEDIKHVALDYKVTIKTNQVAISDIPDKFPCFFANMGDEQETAKKFSFAKGIKVEIFSRKPELLKAIEEYFPDFLMLHNFGTRQSKGFGSFYLKDERYSLEYAFEIDVSRQNSDYQKWKEVFYQIDLFYRTLRSGINLMDRSGPVFYFKSLAFKYARDVMNVQWEKKTIKEEYFRRELEMQENIHDDGPVNYGSENKKLIRDLFGLSSVEKWRVPYRATITKEHSLIDRFKSPILFKPIQLDQDTFRVNFDVDWFPEEIFNQEFTIKKDGRGSLRLKTPPKFDYYNFLDYVANSANFDIYDHVEDVFHGRREFIILDKIYNQLQR